VIVMTARGVESAVSAVFIAGLARVALVRFAVRWAFVRA
jgi:hypothetical protein